MKTVLTKVVDGHRIIIGFDIAVIDPIATTKMIDMVVKNDSRFLGIKKDIEEIECISRGKPLTVGQKERIVQLKKEIAELEKKYQGKLATLKYAVYFQPKIGEEIIPDKKVQFLVHKTE